MIPRWLFAIVLQLVALALFLTGFFPPRVAVPPAESPPDPTCLSSPSVPPTQRLVFMVIDGWRSEFLFDRPKAMPFLASFPDAAFLCRVQHPTVTMPRLKSLLSGTVASYLDVALNFASTEFAEDNWLRRAVSRGLKAVLYGDDTWLKMFPNSVFDERSDGTVSFFVTDYTEVDDNVTRHLPEELGRLSIPSWNVLVLHYLGLDHIGHSVGTRTPLIDVKLKEMDAVAEEIFRSLSNNSDEPFAFVLLGDHGMAAEGGHGGNTYPETHVPVVVLERGSVQRSPNAKPQAVIEQVDVAATIANLLGLDVPVNNLGVSFLHFLTGVDRKVALVALLRNGLQLQRLLRDRIDSQQIANFDDCLASLSAVVCRPVDSKSEVLLARCQKVFKEIQSDLVGRASEYDYPLIMCGLILTFGAVALALSNMNAFLGRSWRKPEVLLVLLQPLCTAASSFVEEEKIVWSFLFATFFLIASFRHCAVGQNLRASGVTESLVLLALQRVGAVLRPSSVEWLSTSGYPDATLVIAAGLVLWLHSWPLPVKVVLAGALFSKPLQWPTDTRSLDYALLLAFFVSLAVQAVFASWSDFLLFWTVSLAAPANRAVLLVCAVIGKVLVQRGGKQDARGLVGLYLACAVSFYFTGNSHSLATLDLSGAYSRLPFYHPVLVGTQLFLCSYSGPILVLIVWQHFARSGACLATFAEFLLAFRLTALFVALVVLTLQRHHLFVWSVFAPKLVYDVLHFAAATLFLVAVKASERVKTLRGL